MGGREQAVVTSLCRAEPTILRSGIYLISFAFLIVALRRRALDRRVCCFERLSWEASLDRR